MKKNYTNPVVEISAFDIDDVVMSSGQINLGSGGNASAAAVDNFKAAAQAAAGEAGAVFVQW